MAFNVRQMPADRAAALIGEDDVAVFSQRLETMAATSQFDLEEPDSTRLTFLFEVGKDDLLREGNWLDGVDYCPISSSRPRATWPARSSRDSKRSRMTTILHRKPSPTSAGASRGSAAPARSSADSVRRRPWIWKRRAMWARIPPMGKQARSSTRKLRRKVRST